MIVNVITIPSKQDGRVLDLFLVGLSSLHQTIFICDVVRSIIGSDLFPDFLYDSSNSDDVDGITPTNHLSIFNNGSEINHCV